MLNSVSDLDLLFDDPATRAKPLAERQPITDMLEDLLERIIAVVEPDLFLEVGAFEAAFSRRMKKAYPTRTVIAMEANPRVHQNFRGELCDTGIEYLNLAASATKGDVDIFIPTVIAGKEMPRIGRMGSLLEVGLRDSTTEKVRVASERVDNVLASLIFERACLWVDVEGFADQVLSGAPDSLTKSSILYVELESSPVWQGQTLARDIIERLEEFGFVRAARDCQKWFQYNALFLKKDNLENHEIINEIQKFKELAKSRFLM